MKVIDKVWRANNILMEAIAYLKEAEWFSEIHITVHSPDNVRSVGFGIKRPFDTKENAIGSAYALGEIWLRDNGLVSTP